jgi:hypothetical protein
MTRRRTAYAATSPVWAGAALYLIGLLARMRVQPISNKSMRAHPSIKRKVFPNLFALLLLASLACSFADNLINGGGFQTVNGPILAVVTAASLDAQGQLVDQSTSFPPTAAQMTVVVQVGPLTSPSTLTVAWYLEGAAGDVKLFEHTIQVDPLDRAYSVGQNPGVLAAGTYKAVATLGSATQTTIWTVAEVQAPPSTSTSSTSNAAQTQSGKPPSSGASGKMPAPQGASGQTSSATGCSPWIDYPFQIPPDILVGVSTIESIPTCAPLGELQLQVQIGNNPPSTACSFTTSPATSVCLSTGDPCLLAGGSDLPGTVFNTSLRQKNGGQVLATNSITFYPDTIPPRVTLTTTPSNGVKVKEGDKIQLTGIAEELKNAGWQTGVSKIEVWQTAPTSEQEGVETYNSYANKSCGAKSWKQTTQVFTYTVPKNPPPQITFCAYGYDFAGNEAKSDNCATFYTGDHWQGTIHSVAHVQDASYTMMATYDSTLDVYVGSSGNVSGSGTSTLTTGCLNPDFQKEGIFPATSFTWSISGKAYKDRFELHINLTGRNGYLCGWSGFFQKNTPLVIPITSPGTAQGTVVDSFAIPASLYNESSEGTVSLTCQSCK